MQQTVKRPIQVKFRINDVERKLLKEKQQKAGLSQQEYLRRCALEKEIISPEGISDLVHEMKKQGSNLNQLAKYMNQNGYFDSRQYHEVMTEVKAVWLLLKQWLHMHQ